MNKGREYSVDKKRCSSRPFFIITLSIASIFVCLVIPGVAYCMDCTRCDPSTKDFFKNFDELYMNNYTKFFKKFYKLEKNALLSADDMACFLEIAKEIKGNAEVSETFHEIVETKILKKHTKLFVQSLCSVGADSLKIIMDDLNHPLFIDPHVARAKLEKFSSSVKCGKLLRSYLDVFPRTPQ